MAVDFSQWTAEQFEELFAKVAEREPELYAQIIKQIKLLDSFSPKSSSDCRAVTVRGANDNSDPTCYGCHRSAKQVIVIGCHRHTPPSSLIQRLRCRLADLSCGT